MPSKHAPTLNDTTIDFTGGGDYLLKKYCPKTVGDMMPPPQAVSLSGGGDTLQDHTLNESSVMSSQASQLPIFCGVFLIARSSYSY